MTQTYPKKVVLLGDGGIGKTTYINTLLEVPFQHLHSYNPTLGVEVHSLYHTDQFLEIWDCAGQEKFQFDQVFIMNDADGVILFCDGTSRISKKNLTFWKSVIPFGVPYVTVQLKSDINQKYAPNGRILVSSKTKYNIDVPFAALSSLM
jgi:GTP-binding nuclear protein Ran